MNLQVIHVRSSIGIYGAEGVILGLLPNLRERGTASRLLCLADPRAAAPELVQRATDLGVDTRVLPCRGRLDWATVLALRAQLAAWPKAIVHVHDYKSAFYAWLARAGRDIPIVATNHGQFPESTQVSVYNWIELKLMARFEKVCPVSTDLLPVLRRAGVQDAKVTVVGNGIDTQRFRPELAPMDLTPFGLAPNSFVFGAAMRLREVKNPIGLLEAFATVSAGLARPCALLLAGDGPLRPVLAARIAALGLQARVHLLGALPDLASFYVALDAFVLPSLYEGLPLGLLEAMACEVPVLVSDVGESRQVLSGLGVAVLRPGDVPELAQAMRAVVMAESPARAARSALRQRVQALYSVDRMAADYLAIYRSLPA